MKTIGSILILIFLPLIVIILLFFLIIMPFALKGQGSLFKKLKVKLKEETEKVKERLRLEKRRLTMEEYKRLKEIDREILDEHNKEYKALLEDNFSELGFKDIEEAHQEFVDMTCKKDIRDLFGLNDSLKEHSE